MSATHYRRTTPLGQHEDVDPRAIVKLHAYPLDFRPRHCGGGLPGGPSCFHDHAGASTPLPKGGLVQGGLLAKARGAVARTFTGRDPRLPAPSTKVTYRTVQRSGRAS